jgi:hypothetical protein
VIHCVRICQPNQSSHLTVRLFGIPEKLFDLVVNVWHLHEMILVEPTDFSFVEMIGDCQNSLLFELGGSLGVNEIAIDIVTLLTLASKVGTNLIGHVLWEHVQRIH